MTAAKFSIVNRLIALIVFGVCTVATVPSFAQRAPSVAAYCATSTNGKFPEGIKDFKNVPEDLCTSIKAAGLKPGNVDRQLATQPTSIKVALTPAQRMDRLVKISENNLQAAAHGKSGTSDIAQDIYKKRIDLYKNLSQSMN